jgi:hypothetical protein
MRFHDRSDAWGTASADFNARSVRYPIVRGNLTKEMLDVEVQIERLTNEVESIGNDRRFFNWLDDFEKKIASFKNLKPEQKGKPCWA